MIANNSKTVQAEEYMISFIHGTDYDKLPQQVIETSKKSILDCIGVALAGSSEPPGKIFIDELKENRGQPQAGVFGGGFRTSVVAASLANGTISHALDYDDISDDWLGHPSAVLVPAVMAMGEKCQSSGKEVLAAYAIGFEVGAKLGVAVGGYHYARGWHSTCLMGSIASAAASAKLLKLDPQETRMALGIAASLAGGLRENFGTMTKPLHAGNAARNGNLAGLLARRGFTASEKWLTADSGFAKAFGADGFDLIGPFSQLGTEFSIISPGIWVKRYPSCGGTHSSIEGALQLREQHSINPDDITEINCTVADYLPKMLIHHRPKTGLQGKFSQEYSISVALLDGEAYLPQFSDERASKPDVQEFLRKVKYQISPELGDKIDHDIPVTIRITLKNGEKLSMTENTATGKPNRPMSTEQLTDKFKNCAGVLAPNDLAEVMELTLYLERQEGITRLMAIVAGTD